MSKAAVVIFARAPRPGRVKTRLIPLLTARQALALHVACLQTTAALIASLPRAIHKYLYFTGSLTTAHAQARKLHLPAAVTIRRQRGRDLGMRLERMFRELFTAGYERVVVIGSDTPTLPRTRLLETLAALRRVDVVIGPTEDGGYYLLGCRRLASDRGDTQPLPEIFHGIPWGTSKTFTRTVARLARARVQPALRSRKARARPLRYRMLPRGYDVDRPRDLLRLARELVHTRKPYLAPLLRYFAR
ncbi:MAG: TIGR04282 family arsenosugar biosynthesis glycosyltransferase [Terriglobia bacterium]